MNTLTKRSAEQLASADTARWDAVLGARHDVRRPLRLRRQLDRRLLPAVVPQPPAAARSRAFFETPAAARAAGFRACRRCKPDAAAAAPIRGSSKIRRACVYLANVDGHPSLATLAARLGGSPYHLQRNFKRLVGVTPREYADAVPPAQGQGARCVSAATSPARCSTPATDRAAASTSARRPSSAWRRRPIAAAAPAWSIGYTIVDSHALGRLLVAATSRGVCAVAMGASDAELTRALSREYPAATITADAGALARWTSAILAHLAGGGRAWICRSTCRRRRFSGRSGRRSRRFRTARRARTARWPLHRPAACGACRRTRLRHQSGGARDSVPPGRARGRRHGRLPLGSGAEGSAVSGTEGQEGNRHRGKAGREGDGSADDCRGADDRRSARGSRLGRRRGVARRPGVRALPAISTGRVPTLAGLYSQDTRFRSRIDMSRFRFGVGEYKYFAAPLPGLSSRCARSCIRDSRRSRTVGRSG